MANGEADSAHGDGDGCGDGNVAEKGVAEEGGVGRYSD